MSSFRTRILSYLLLILISGLLPNIASAASDSKEANKRYWNLQNADIKTVVEQVAVETGKNFILDDRVKGQVTVVSQQPINSDEVYQMFLSVLQVLGFSAVEGENAIKIVPDATARHMGLPIAGAGLDATADMVVQVIPIKYVSALALVPVLRPLVSPQGGHLSAYGPSNRVIIADRRQVVERLVEIVRRVDVDDSHDIEVLSIKHAIPSELVNVLNTITNSRKPGEVSTTHVTLAADDRSNTIIMSGDKSKRLKLRAIIANLDIEAPGTGNTEVIYINYQRAEDLVPVIVNVIQSYFGANAGNQKKQGGGANSSVLNNMRTGGNSIRHTNNSSSSDSSDVGSGLEVEEREAVGTVIGGFGVQAEPNLNALVVTAPQGLLRTIKGIIAKLDVRRAQVLVEAIVVELEETASDAFGIDWRLGGAGVGGFTTGSSSDTGSIKSIATALKGGKVPDFATGLSVGILKGGNIRALLNAIESQVGSNILATPSVVALDNSKAKIFVGDKVPFESNKTTTTEGTTVSSVTREDVGLGLAIVPRITSNGSIMLAIEQKADTVVPAKDSANLLVQTTTNRLINNKVIVNNGDILVLGGLIRSQEDTTETKIPLLGDIPLLGQLFRSEKQTTAKRNLMVFLRPTILYDANDSLTVTGAKYEFMRDKLLLNHLDRKQKANLEAERIGLPPLEGEALASLPDPF